jgi:mono/diheme cytochrome c family protein
MNRIPSLLGVALTALFLGACEGSDGNDGPPGPAGADWPGPAPAAYTAADGLRGGAAYSSWYLTSGGGRGGLTDYAITAPVEFVRCKACHGWDGLGTGGSYAARTGISTGTASRPDVSPVNLRATIASSTYQELYDLVARPTGRPLNAADSRHPDYSSALTASQIWDLVKFMREEWVGPNEFYDLAVTGPVMHYDSGGVLVSPTLTYTDIGKDGNAAAGATAYAAKCAGCHGADGTTVTIGTGGLGAFTRASPHESWFKTKFGQQSANMPPGLVTSTQELKDLYKALASPVDYP